jgi:hypothetical protein
LCTKIESCTGILYCNGGANVDTVAQLDSLKEGLSCVRDGSNLCADAESSVCCSNACEGVGVGSGNPTTRVAGVNSTNSGAGAMLLMCRERIVPVDLPPGDCATADFESASVTDELYTTGVSTAKVINHCAGSGAAGNRPVSFSRTGQNFDCASWTTENGPGVLAFAIPSEEGSDLFTGDGGNAGIFSDAPAPTPTPTRTSTTGTGVTPTSTVPPSATVTRTQPGVTPTQPQLTPTQPQMTPTRTQTAPVSGLGVRVFSINDKPRSDFFSSALGGLGVGALPPSFTAGPLKIVAGAIGANGIAPLSLQEDAIFGLRVVDNSVVCLKLVAAASSGSIDCDGGTPYDVTVTQDSQGDQPALPNILVTGEGTDGGAGAATLSVMMEAALLPIGSSTASCPTATFNIMQTSAFTTRKATATVLNALADSPSADPTGKISVSVTGRNFTCDTFATENAVGTLVAPFIGLDQNAGEQIIDTANVLQLADR